MHTVQQVGLEEATSHLTELINAAMRGEDVVIVKDDRSMVKLVPLHSVKRQRRAGSAKGMITMADDFDAPLEDFTDYVP